MPWYRPRICSGCCCRTLAACRRRKSRTGRLASATRAELNELLGAFLLSQDASRGGVVLIVDEAQSLPPATVEQIIALASMDANRDKALQIVLAGQPAVGGGPGVPKAIDQLLTTRARLLSLERDECDRYIAHRLAIAGGAGVVFDARAIDVIYALSGGVARLVNLLCVHGLQQAAAAKVTPGRGRDDRIGGVRLRARPPAAEALPLVRHASTVVPHGGSSRRFLTEVPHGGSSRRFLTEVPHGGSSTEVPRTEPSMEVREPSYRTLV